MAYTLTGRKGGTVRFVPFENGVVEKESESYSSSVTSNPVEDGADINDHVNNVHYVEWALEALPVPFRSRSVRELDIVFRQAAHAGDELEARTEIVDGANLRCAIVRPADGALLATAALTFGPP